MAWLSQKELWKNSLCCTKFLQGCGPGSKQPTILQKAELILHPCERCKFWYSCKKTFLVKISSQLSCWSRVYFCNFMKSRLHQWDFSHVFWKIALLKTSRIFLQDIFVIHLPRKLQASTENVIFDKNI